MKGKLYLIPSPLGDYDPEVVIPAPTLELLQRIGCYVVEEVRTARRYLSRAGLKGHIQELEFHILNEHTSAAEVERLVALFEDGRDVGLISEAGLGSGGPGVRAGGALPSPRHRSRAPGRAVIPDDGSHGLRAERPVIHVLRLPPRQDGGEAQRHKKHREDFAVQTADSDIHRDSVPQRCDVLRSAPILPSFDQDLHCSGHHDA